MDVLDSKILIVDDVLMNLQITAQILKEEGYKFSLAQDGKSALNLLENETPDLILLDIMMPEMDGLEVCRIIKKDERLKEIPVIFITAFNQSDDLVEGFKAGGVDYISKPFNRDELLMRVKTHLELSLSKKMLIETIKTRDKLYSIIAHDIRSPFNNIIMLIESIAAGIINVSSKEFKEVIFHLEKSTRETGTLLDNLLDWTKLHIGKITLRPQNTHVLRIINDCIRLLEGNARYKNISIGKNIPVDLMAYFDEVTMHTIFRNIISNAIKFTPENGKIKIETNDTGSYISVIISDTGIGISNEVLSKIFDKNESYSSLGTKNEHGSGLGLQLVKDMVEQNNGTIRVESELDKGTTFIVNIPKKGD